MSLRYGFFDAGKSGSSGANFDRTYSAEEVSNTFNGVISQGVLPYIYINGEKKDLHFNITINGMSVTIGPGKAYYANLFAYSDANQTYSFSSDGTNPRYGVIYLVFDKRIAYTNDTTIEVKDAVYFAMLQGTAAASPSLPSTSTDLDIYYMPLVFVKIPAKVTSLTSGNVISAFSESGKIIFDSKSIDGTAYVSSIVGTTDLSKISDTGTWGYTNGEYDQKYETLSSNYNNWFNNDIKGSNFKDSSAGLLMDYYTRAKAIEKNKKTDQVVIYVKSMRKNLSGKTIIAHNNTYPQYADVTATFSISTTTPEAVIYLEHIGEYTLRQPLNGDTFNVSVPYFGEYYIEIKVNYGAGDIYGFRVKGLNTDKVEYVKNYIYNTNYECINSEYEPMRIDWSTGKPDGNYQVWENAFFMPHPVIIDKDGKEVYTLDKNDLTKMINQETGEITNIFTTEEMLSKGYNVMQAFPKVYVARFTKDGYAYCYISEEKIDDRFQCWAHVNYKGEEIPYFYRSVYLGSNYNWALRSVSGTTPYTFGPRYAADATDYTGNVKDKVSDDGNLVTAQKMARNNNTSKPIWNVECLADLNLIKDYIVLLTKSFRTYETLGATTYSYEPLQNGLMDAQGQFYSNGQLKIEYSTYFSETVAKVNNGEARYCKMLGIERLHSENIRYCLGFYSMAIQSMVGTVKYQPTKFVRAGISLGSTYLLGKNTYDTTDTTSITDWVPQYTSWNTSTKNVGDGRYEMYDYTDNPNMIGMVWAYDRGPNGLLNAHQKYNILHIFNDEQYYINSTISYYNQAMHVGYKTCVRNLYPGQQDVYTAPTYSNSVTPGATCSSVFPKGYYESTLEGYNIKYPMILDYYDSVFGFIFDIKSYDETTKNWRYQSSKNIITSLGCKRHRTNSNTPENNFGARQNWSPASLGIVVAGATRRAIYTKWDEYFYTGPTCVANYNLFNEIVLENLLYHIDFRDEQKNNTLNNHYENGDGMQLISDTSDSINYVTNSQGKISSKHVRMEAALTCRPEASVFNS